MLFLIAFVGAAVIALVLWKAMNTSRSEAPPAVEPIRAARPGCEVRGRGVRSAW